MFRSFPGVVALLFFTVFACSSDHPRPAPSEPKVSSIESAVSVSPSATAAPTSLDEIVPNTYVVSTAAAVDNVNAPPFIAGAFGGSNYFVAWIDRRFGPGVVMGSFLSENGQPLQPAGLILSSLPRPSFGAGEFFGTSDPRELIVTANGTGAMLAWYESDVLGGDVLNLVRVLNDGTISRSTLSNTVISGGSFSANTVHWFTADSSGFCYFYYARNLKGAIDLVYSRIDGTNPPSAPVVLLSDLKTSLDGGSGYPIYASSNATSAFVQWGALDGMGGPAFSDRYFTVSFASKAPVTPRRLSALGLADYFAGASSNATSHYVNEITYTADTYTLRTIHLNSSGDLIGTGVPVTGPKDYFPGGNGFVPTTTPGTFLARFSNPDSTTCIVRFGMSTASPCTAATPPSGRTGLLGDVGWWVGTSTFLEALPNSSNINSQIGLARGARYPLAAPTTSETILFSRGANQQTVPSVASNGSDYLVAWVDSRTSVADASPAIFAQRVDTDGKPLASPLQISTGTLRDSSAPKVVFDGQKYFIVWSESDALNPNLYRIRGAVVPSTGPIAVDKLLTIDEPGNPSTDVTVGSDGLNRIVVWTSLGTNVVGKRVLIANDTVVDSAPQVIVSSQSAFAITPQIAFSGSRTLIAWAQLTTSYSFSVVGAFINPGEIKPTEPVRTLMDQVGLIFDSRIAASDDGTFLVVGTKLISDEGAYNLVTRFIDKDGKMYGFNDSNERVADVLNSFIPLVTGRFDARHADVAYSKDRATFMVTWEDDRSGEYDIRAAWVNYQNGNVHDKDAVPVATRSDVREISPAVAIARDGKGLVAYQELVSGTTTNAYRLRFRTFESGKLRGASCTTNDECGTRQCVEGLCCENACADGCGVCNAVPGTCTPKPSGTACGKFATYQCNGTSTACPSACESDQDCVAGKCISGLCVVPGSACIDDSNLRGPDGVVTACGDYRCKANSCRNPCSDASDCKEGLVCTFDGTCKLPPPIVNSDGACNMGSAGNPVVGSVAALFGALAFVRRYRRARMAKGVDR